MQDEKNLASIPIIENSCSVGNTIVKDRPSSNEITMDEDTLLEMSDNSDDTYVPTENYRDDGQNEEFNSCGSACPPTCSQTEPQAFIQVCRKVCFCKSGYYRHEYTHNCVKRDQCSETEDYQVCGENEEFNSCGSACPPTCSQPEPEDCIQVCREGCFCKPGYYTDDCYYYYINMCEIWDQYSENCCPENEVCNMCNAGCQPSCSNTDPFGTNLCVAGCVCTPGLQRNDYGECVRVDKCFENGSQNSFLYNLCGLLYVESMK
ncbi:unnamed protein product [Parnassius apollo]|uniref:(apollo) hypothetical protein n=1 Tax=Parnassius apollo TaxID=110799 RepID=A0A8S3W698_PARAO|nr:unnamed protein product [Parnassius apollo]